MPRDLLLINFVLLCIGDCVDAYSGIEEEAERLGISPAGLPQAIAQAIAEGWIVLIDPEDPTPSYGLTKLGRRQVQQQQQPRLTLADVGLYASPEGIVVKFGIGGSAQ